MIINKHFKISSRILFLSTHKLLLLSSWWLCENPDHFYSSDLFFFDSSKFQDFQTCFFHFTCSSSSEDTSSFSSHFLSLLHYPCLLRNLKLRSVDQKVNRMQRQPLLLFFDGDLQSRDSNPNPYTSWPKALYTRSRFDIHVKQLNEGRPTRSTINPTLKWRADRQEKRRRQGNLFKMENYKNSNDSTEKWLHHCQCCLILQELDKIRRMIRKRTSLSARPEKMMMEQNEWLDPPRRKGNWMQYLFNCVKKERERERDIRNNLFHCEIQSLFEKNTSST